MLKRADVFVQNLKPGAIEKLGFPIAELRREFPRLICCSISGFGETGRMPDSSRSAPLKFATTIQRPEIRARCGIASRKAVSLVWWPSLHSGMDRASDPS